MLQVEFDDHEVIYGSEISNDSISEIYKQKIELVKSSGIDSDDAKLVVLFPNAFKMYNKFLGGMYVAS